MNVLGSSVQQSLQALPDVSRLAALQRSATLYSQSQAADSVFLINEGLIKLTRSSREGDKIILAICGPGQLVGDESLNSEQQNYYTEAVVLTPASVVKIPREAVTKAIGTDPELSGDLVSYLLHRKFDLAEKVELLCLHDVEYRIRYYLARLSALLGPSSANGEFQIPLTQSELADLVGATRETTSTTLNQLERKGLVKLSRRLMTIASAESLGHGVQTDAPVSNLSSNGAHS